MQIVCTYVLHVTKQGGSTNRERCDRSSATGCDYRALRIHVIIY